MASTAWRAHRQLRHNTPSRRCYRPHLCLWPPTSSTRAEERNVDRRRCLRCPSIASRGYWSSLGLRRGPPVGNRRPRELVSACSLRDVGPRRSRRWTATAPPAGSHSRWGASRPRRCSSPRRRVRAPTSGLMPPPARSRLAGWAGLHRYRPANRRRASAIYGARRADWRDRSVLRHVWPPSARERTLEELKMKS